MPYIPFREVPEITVFFKALWVSKIQGNLKLTHGVN